MTTLSHDLVMFVLIAVAVVVGGILLGRHHRAQVRARDHTLDLWCAGRGWRREQDPVMARRVGRATADGAGVAVDGVEHVVHGTTADGREAVAVGSTYTESNGGERGRTRQDVVVAVRLRGYHPDLRLGPRPVLDVFDPDRRRRVLSGDPAVDGRLRIAADDGAHAATVAPHDVLVHLAGDPYRTAWVLRGEWLSAHRRGTLDPSALEPLLGLACWFASRIEHATSPAPVVGKGVAVPTA